MPNNEFSIPFGESRRAKIERIDTKALGRNLAARVASRLTGRPTIGKRRGRRGRDIDLPTGGNPGTRRPTGSNFDPDNDGWVDEGTTRPRFVGTSEQLATGMRRRAATQSRAIVQTRKKPITETSQEDKAKQASKKRILLSSGSRKDVTQWERVGGQKGSNEGGFYRDENGEMFYVKWPKENLQSETEVLANQLYKMADVYVPDIELGQDSQGAEVVISKVIPGIDPIYPGDASQEEIDELASNFIFDAWLSNWDSVLSANSNRTPDGRAVRIDTGGALLFRAQGARKGDRFGETVGEIDTMRDYDMTEAAGIFGELTDEQLTEQAGRLAKLDPRDIEDKTRELISDQEEQDNLVNLLLARRKDILDRFGVPDPYEGRATRSGKLSSGSRKIDDKTILKHRQTAYKYGDKSALSGKPMRAYTRGWLAGLTSKQMAALLVPDSEDAFLDVVTDQLIGETAFNRGLSAESFAKAKRDELKEAIRKAVRENRGLGTVTVPLFTPEEVSKTRLALERALDNSPGLKWAMQRFGSPPFRSNSTDAGRDPVTGFITSAYYAPLFGITLLESFHTATPNWNPDGPKLRDWSIDDSQASSIIHEWGHYLETSIKRLAESLRFSDYFIDPRRTGARQAVAIDIDHHMFRGGHFDRTRVGEPANVGAPSVARLASLLYASNTKPESTLFAGLATHNMQTGLFSRDAEAPGLITAYGNSSVTEMFPEALTAIMHPNQDVEERSITKELSKFVRYALGISLDTKDRPWLAFAQREKEFVERTTPNARTAQRTGPATRRVIADQKLSSGSRKKPVRKIESIEDYLEDNFDEPDVVTDEFIDSSFEVFDKVEEARKTIEELKKRGLSKEKVLTEIGKRPELLGPIVLNGYVGDRYKTINQFARGQTDAEEYFDSINFADLDGRVGPTVKTAKALQAMDHMFETSATKMPKKGVVYRGMIVDDDDAEEHFSEFVVGSRFRDDGFVSTSVDPQVASRFGGDDYPDYELEGKTRVVMKVTVPKGMDVLVTNGLPDRLGNEGELVLQRGLEYQVTSVTDITDPLDMGRPILFVEVRALPKKAAKTSKSTQKLSSGSRKLSNSEIVENDITAGIREHQAGDISFAELLERGWYEAKDPSGEIRYTPFEEFPYHKDTYQDPSDELKKQAVAEKARRVIARPIDLSQVNSQKQYSMRVLAEHIMKEVIEALLASSRNGTREYDTSDGRWRIDATVKRIREQYPTGIPTEGRSDGTSTPLMPLETGEIQQVFDLFDWGALKDMLDEIVKHAMIEEYKGGGYVNLRKYAVAGMEITPDSGLRAMEGQRKLYLTIKDIPYIGLEVRTDVKMFATPLNAYPVHETTIPTEYGVTLMNAALENLAVRVAEPTTLYRGIKQITRPMSTVMSDDLKLADEQLKELLDSLVPGLEFESSTFLSTTLSAPQGQLFAGWKDPGMTSVVLAIGVPQGQKTLVGTSGETELILPPGSQFRVVSVERTASPTSGLQRIFARLELVPESERSDGPVRKLASGSRTNPAHEAASKLFDDYERGDITYDDMLLELRSLRLQQPKMLNDFVDTYGNPARLFADRFTDLESRVVPRPIDMSKMPPGRRSDFNKLAKLISQDIVKARLSLGYPYSREEVRSKIAERIAQFKNINTKEFVDLTYEERQLSPLLAAFDDDEFDQVLSMFDLGAFMDLIDTRVAAQELYLFTGSGFAELRDYSLGRIDDSPLSLRRTLSMPSFGIDGRPATRNDRYEIRPSGIIRLLSDITPSVMPPTKKEEIVYRGMRLDVYRDGDDPKVAAFKTIVDALEPGAVFETGSFSSSSVDYDTGTNFAALVSRSDDSIVLSVRIPEGTPMLIGEPLEGEFILPAGAKFRVLSVKKIKGLPADASIARSRTGDKVIAEVELLPSDSDVVPNTRLASGSRKLGSSERIENQLDELIRQHENGEITYREFIMQADELKGGWSESLEAGKYHEDNYSDPMKRNSFRIISEMATRVIAQPIDIDKLSEEKKTFMRGFAETVISDVIRDLLAGSYQFGDNSSRISETLKRIRGQYPERLTSEINQVLDSFDWTALKEMLDEIVKHATIGAYETTAFGNLREYAITGMQVTTDSAMRTSVGNEQITIYTGAIPYMGLEVMPLRNLPDFTFATTTIKVEDQFRLMREALNDIGVRVNEPVTVYRGINMGFLEKNEPAKFKAMTELIEALVPGAEFGSSTFLSTTLEAPTGMIFAKMRNPDLDSVVFSIDLPEGEKVLVGTSFERELILSPESRFRVVSVNKTTSPDGQHKIFARLESIPENERSSDEVRKLASGSRAKAKEILDTVGPRQIEFKQPVQSNAAFTVGYDAHDVAQSILTRIKINDDLLARKSSVDDRILQLIQDSPSVLGSLIRRWTKNRDEGNENRSLNKLMRELYRKLIEDSRAADLTSLPDRVSRLSDWVIRYGGRGQSIPTSQIDDLLDELDSVDLEIVNQVMRDNPVLALWSAHSYDAYIPDVTHLDDPDMATESDLVASLVKANTTTQLAADIEKLGVTAEEAQDVIDLLGPIVQASAMKIGNTYKSRTGQDASPIVLLANEATKQWARTAGDNATPSILVQIIAGRMLPELTGSGTGFIDYASTLDGDTPDSEGVGKIRKRTLDEAMELADNPLVAKVIGAILTSQWARTQEYLDRVAPNGTVQLHRGMTHQGMVRDILVQNGFARRTPEEIATSIGSAMSDAEEAVGEFKAITEEHNDKVAVAQETYLKLVTLTQTLEELQQSNSAKDREEAANIKRQIAKMKQSYRDLQEETAKLKTESEDRRDSAERAIDALQRHVDVARSISEDSWYGKVDTRQLPLSSTATAKGSTLIFSGENPEISAGDAPVMITMSVPNTSILSTAVTGFGCLEENEFIISHPILRDVVAKVDYGPIGDWQLESLTDSYEWGQMIGLDFSSIATLYRRELPKV